MSIFDDASRAELYRDRDALRDSHNPDTIVGRDAEKEKFMDALLPVINGSTPENIFLVGPHGVGKTALTRWMMAELQDADTTVPVHCLHINCENVSTGYNLMIRMVNRFRGRRGSTERLSSQGYPTSQVVESVFDELNRLEGTLILILDELDTVSDPDTLLYEMTNAGTPESLLESDLKIGLVGVTNDATFLDRLEPKVKTRLAKTVINFGEYDANQLREVLEHRAEIAFREDTLDSDVIPLAAAFGAQHSGDARAALDILRLSGDIAQKSGDEMVTDEHVREAESEYTEEYILSNVSALSSNAKRALYSLITLEANGSQKPPTEEVYQRYQGMAEISDLAYVKRRQFRNHLERLDESGVTMTERRVGSNGNRRYHTLTAPAEAYIPHLEDEMATVGVHHTVQDMVSEETLEKAPNLN